MRKIGLCAALLCLTLPTAFPAVAQSGPASAELQQQLEAVFDSDDLAKVKLDLLDIAASADEAIAADPAAIDSLREIAGTSYILAAQLQAGEDLGKADKSDVRPWLVKGLDYLRPAIAAGKAERSLSTFETGTDLLFEAGVLMKDSRLEQWSAERLATKRRALAAATDRADINEKRNQVALALYDHGWPTQDPALMTEAASIHDAIPEEDQSFNVWEAQQAISEGRAPYERFAEFDQMMGEIDEDMASDNGFADEGPFDDGEGFAEEDPLPDDTMEP